MSDLSGLLALLERYNETESNRTASDQNRGISTSLQIAKLPLGSHP